jgi:hypothetical protein
MIEFVSIGLGLLEKIFPHLGKVDFDISDVEMQLDVPRKSDGEGGFIHSSRGNFFLEIINRKKTNVIIEDIHCVAYQDKTVIQDNICCNDKTTYHKVAMTSTYNAVPSISIPGNGIAFFNIVIYSNADLSQCNKLTLSYLRGRKRREVTVYERLEKKNE